MQPLSQMRGVEEDLKTEGSRRNGWSLPLHPLQVGGWVAVLFFILVYFGTMVPTLPNNWQLAGYIVSFRESIVIFRDNYWKCIIVINFSSAFIT